MTYPAIIIAFSARLGSRCIATLRQSRRLGWSTAVVLAVAWIVDSVHLDRRQRELSEECRDARKVAAALADQSRTLQLAAMEWSRLCRELPEVASDMPQRMGLPALSEAAATFSASLYEFSKKDPAWLTSTAPRPLQQEIVLASLRQRQLDLRRDYYVNMPIASTAGNGHRSSGRLNLCLVLEAMNAVEERINTVNYDYLANHGQTLPASRVEAFEHGAGICGHHVDAFLYLVRNLGFEARSVQLFGKTAEGNYWSHIGAEVMLDGKYRLFDVTYEMIFTRKNPARSNFTVDDLLSLEEARALESAELHVFENRLDGWKHLSSPEIALHDFGSFLRGECPASVVTGMSGPVQAMCHSDAAGTRAFKPDGIPNFIGATDDHGMRPQSGMGIELELSDLIRPERVEVDVQSLACNDASRTLLVLRDADTGRILREHRLMAGPKSDETVTFTIPREPGYEVRNLRIAVNSGIDPSSADQHCYALWKEVRVQSRSGNLPAIQPASFEAQLDSPDAKSLRR